ncbi:hypothetical protein Save01_07376 [Streptomyces avermitilis]
MSRHLALALALALSRTNLNLGSGGVPHHLLAQSVAAAADDP